MKVPLSQKQNVLKIKSWVSALSPTCIRRSTAAERGMHRNVDFRKGYRSEAIEFINRTTRK